MRRAWRRPTLTGRAPRSRRRLRSTVSPPSRAARRRRSPARRARAPAARPRSAPRARARRGPSPSVDRDVEPAARPADARAVDALGGRDHERRRARRPRSGSSRAARRIVWPSRLIARGHRERRQAPLHLGEEARRVVAAPELLRAQDVEREPARRRHAVDLGLLERAQRRARSPPGDPPPRRRASRSASRSRARSSSPPRGACRCGRPGPSGGRKRVDRSRRGREAAGRILGVQPDLERVPAARRAAGQRRAARPRRSAAARGRGRCRSRAR